MIPSFHKNHHASPCTLTLGSYVSLCSLLAIIICFFLIPIFTFYLQCTFYSIFCYYLIFLRIWQWMNGRKKEALWLKIHKVEKQEQSWGYEAGAIVRFTCAKHMFWSRYEPGKLHMSETRCDDFYRLWFSNTEHLYFSITRILVWYSRKPKTICLSLFELWSVYVC